jgi:hypothetical protein
MERNMSQEYYDKLPSKQKEEMDKYFPIVKKHIDEFDPIGVMDTAPKDHYDKESRAIAFHMSGDCNVSDFLDVSQEIYIVLAYWFGKNQIVESDCHVPAVEIVREIGKL